jgi:hypothetical protein
MTRHQSNSLPTFASQLPEGQPEAEVLVARDQLFDRLREGGAPIASDAMHRTEANGISSNAF